MDIDQEHFRKALLEILRNIANADYVTLDLEMSGISTRQPGDHRNSGKPTLEEQYQECKDAASIFQIIQLGITCIEADEEKGYYIARPYNFNVNPRSAEGVDLKLERIFSFSSSACDFLIKNKFDFGKIFTHGVPYLSRDEEMTLTEEYNTRADRNAKLDDIAISLHDKVTLEFSRSVRRTIRTWLAAPKPKQDYVNISHPEGHIKDGQVNALTGYQKRLVHQIVRNEYPKLKVVGKKDGTFMQVTALDLEEEKRFQAKRLRQFKSQICRQKALSWIFEALAHGNLSDIDPEWLASKSSEAPEDQLPAVKNQLGRIIKALQTKQHVIVGHNLFMDLAFIHKTFVGPLPYKVDDFQRVIHKLFPIVIDTKYLATYEDNAMNPRSNLKELLAPFKKIHLPLVVLQEDHTAYGGPYGKEHEAGYDSWMTAELFIKLSAKIYSTFEPTSFAKFLDHELGYESDSSDDGGVSLKKVRSPVKPPKKKKVTFDLPPIPLSPEFLTREYDTIRHTHPNAGSFGASQDLIALSPTRSSPPMTEYAQHAFPTNSTTPLTRTQFDQLGTNSFAQPSKASRPSKAIPIIHPNAPKTTVPTTTSIPKTVTPPPAHVPGNHATAERDAVPRSIHAAKLNPTVKLIHDTDEEAATTLAAGTVEQWLPGMEERFWVPYLNVLRVNAAQGGICDLAEHSDEDEVSSDEDF